MTKTHVADAFLPNRAVSPNVFKILLVGEAIMAIADWKRARRASLGVVI